MAVAFGKVNAFNPSQDEWPLYVERLEHVFVANGITDGAKKQAVFLSVIGATNYKLLSSLVAPAKPGEKEYSELVDKLAEHFTPHFLRNSRTFQISHKVSETWGICRSFHVGTPLHRQIMQLRGYPRNDAARPHCMRNQ